MRIKELELKCHAAAEQSTFSVKCAWRPFTGWRRKKDMEQTEEMDRCAGGLYSSSVSRQPWEFVTIREEIENAKSYLRILTILYEKTLDVRWKTDREIMDGRTIKLILQPVIENAFEHGIRSNETGRTYHNNWPAYGTR